jgi:hypothetical protein
MIVQAILKPHLGYKCARHFSAVGVLAQLFGDFSNALCGKAVAAWGTGFGILDSFPLVYLHVPTRQGMYISNYIRAVTSTHHWPVLILGASIQVFAGIRKHLALTY